MPLLPSIPTPTHTALCTGAPHPHSNACPLLLLLVFDLVSSFVCVCVCVCVCVHVQILAPRPRLRLRCSAPRRPQPRRHFPSTPPPQRRRYGSRLPVQAAPFPVAHLFCVSHFLPTFSLSVPLCRPQRSALEPRRRRRRRFLSVRPQRRPLRRPPGSLSVPRRRLGPPQPRLHSAQQHLQQYVVSL